MTPSRLLLLFLLLLLILGHSIERGDEGEAETTTLVFLLSREVPLSVRRLQPKFAKPVPVAGKGGTIKREKIQQKSTAKNTKDANKQATHVLRHNAKLANQQHKSAVKTRRYGTSTTTNGKGGKMAGGKPIAPTSQVQSKANHQQAVRNQRNGHFGTGSTKQAPTPKNLRGGRSSRAPSSSLGSRSGGGGSGSGSGKSSTRRPQFHATRKRGVTSPTSIIASGPNFFGKNGLVRIKKKTWSNSTRGGGRRNGKGRSGSFTSTRPAMVPSLQHRFVAKKNSSATAAGGRENVGNGLTPIVRHSGHRPARPTRSRATTEAPRAQGGRNTTRGGGSSGHKRPGSLKSPHGVGSSKLPRRVGSTKIDKSTIPTSSSRPTSVSKPVHRKPSTPHPSFVYGRRGRGTPRPSTRPTYNPAFPRPTFIPTFFNPPPPKGFVARTSNPTARPTHTPHPTLRPTTLREGIQKDNSGSGARYVAAQTIGYGNYSNPAKLNLPPASALLPPESARTVPVTPASLPTLRPGTFDYKTLVKRYKLSPAQVHFFYIFLRTKWPAGLIHLTSPVQQVQIQVFNGLRNVSQSPAEQRRQNGFWISAVMMQMVNDPAAFNELASRAVRNIVWAGLARTNDPAMMQAAGQQMAGINLGITGSMSILDNRINCGQISTPGDVNQRICRRLGTGKREAEEEGEALTGDGGDSGGGVGFGVADDDERRRLLGDEDEGLDSLLHSLQQKEEQQQQWQEQWQEREQEQEQAQVQERQSAQVGGVEADSVIPFRFRRGAPTPRPTNSWEAPQPSPRPTPNPTLINQNTDITPLAGLTFYLAATYCVECIGAATNGRISYTARIGRIVSAALQDRVIVEEAFQEAARTSADIVISSQLSEMDVQVSVAAEPTLFYPVITGLRLAFTPTPRPSWTPPFTTGPTISPSVSVWAQIGFPPTNQPTPQPSPIPGTPSSRPTPRPSRPTPNPTSIPTPAPTPLPTTRPPTFLPTRRPISVWVAPSLPTASPTRSFATSLPTASVNANSNAGDSGRITSSSMTTIIVIACLLPVVSILGYLGYRSFGSANAEEKRKKKWALQNMLKVIEENDDDDEVAIKRNSIHEFYKEKAKAVSPPSRIAAVQTRPPRPSQPAAPPAAEKYRFDPTRITNTTEEEAPVPKNELFTPHIVNLKKERAGSLLSQNGARPGYSIRSQRQRDPTTGLPAGSYGSKSFPDY